MESIVAGLNDTIKLVQALLNDIDPILCRRCFLEGRFIMFRGLSGTVRRRLALGRHLEQV